MRVFLTVSSVSLFVSTAAIAALLTFTDRVAFTDSVGTLLSEDFEGFSSDTRFNAILPEISDFSLEITKNSPDRVGGSFNIIESVPYQGGASDPAFQNSVNGSNFALIGIEDDGDNVGDVFSILFEYDVFAFGADFAKLNDNGVERSEIGFLDAQGNSLGTFTPPTEAGGTTRFFGFASDEGFRAVTFTAISGTNAGEGFGLDNMLYSEPTEVPLPASLPLLLAGIAAMRISRARKSLSD